MVARKPVTYERAFTTTRCMTKGYRHLSIDGIYNGLARKIQGVVDAGDRDNICCGARQMYLGVGSAARVYNQ
jgi:hypothetical protein